VTTMGRGGLSGVARMEWRKLRTLQSTYWILLVFAAGMVGAAVINGAADPLQPAPSYDPTQDALSGVALGQLAIGILGVLTLSSEFTTGSIRATFAAVPRRGRVLAAKTTVMAALTLAAGEMLAFAAFAAFQAAASHGAPHVSLGQPGVLRAVLLAGVYPCLIGLIGIGLAALVRYTAGAIAVLVGVVFVLPLVLLPLGEHSTVEKFLPWMIALNSLTAVKPVTGSLPAIAGLGMLCLYAAVMLAAGGWAMVRRDA
jgi:ABC-2 type transport system permease protein